MPFADHPWNQKIKVAVSKKKRNLAKHSKGIPADQTVVTQMIEDYLKVNKPTDLSKLNSAKGK